MLTALLHRKRKESFVSKSHPSSCVPYQHLSDSEKISRLRNVHEILRSSQSQVAYLQRKLQENLDERSVTVDCSLHEDLCRVMHEETGRITAQYESGSFERLLWEHQERAVKTAPQSMRWHPVLIRWCLYLRHLSSSAYNLMRESGIRLPSQRTLRDYTYYTTATFGFSGIYYYTNK